MKFEWDENKRLNNVRKHELDFVDAPEIFTKPMVTRLDTRANYGEDRWISIGQMKNRVVVVVYTERKENIIRIISLRKAVKREQNLYFKYITY